MSPEIRKLMGIHRDLCQARNALQYEIEKVTEQIKKTQQREKQADDRFSAALGISEEERAGELSCSFCGIGQVWISEGVKCAFCVSTVIKVAGVGWKPLPELKLTLRHGTRKRGRLRF
jgi:hypothetical protein